MMGPKLWNLVLLFKASGLWEHCGLRCHTSFGRAGLLLGQIKGWWLHSSSEMLGYQLWETMKRFLRYPAFLCILMLF